MSDDDTLRIPIIHAPEPTLPRWVLPALAGAYFMAGGVLTFACLVLAHAANEIINTPLCRRL